MNRIEQLQKMLELQPNDAFLLHALALENVKLEQWQAARQHWETLLAHQPSYVGAYYHLAKLYEVLGEVNLADETYQKGMQVAKQAKDNHAFNELQAAWEDFSDV